MGEFESLFGVVPARGMALIATDPLESPLQGAYVTFRSVPANSYQINVSLVRIYGDSVFMSDIPGAAPDAYRWVIWQERTTGQLELLNTSTAFAAVTVRVRDLDGNEVCESTLSVSGGHATNLSLPRDLRCVNLTSGSYLFDISSTQKGLAVAAYEFTSNGSYMNTGSQSR